MAQIARLGLAFDAAPAKRGAAEAQQSLNALGATAQRTAATMDKATRDATTRLIEQATAVRAVSGAASAALPATTALGESLRKTSGAGQLGAKVLAEVRAELAATAQASLSAASGLGGLTTGTTVAARGLGGMAAALGALPGAGTAALAVITVLPMIFQAIAQKAEEAERQAKRFREELEKMSPTALQAAVDTEKAYQAQLRSQQALTLGARRAREAEIAVSDARLRSLQQAQGSQANAVGLARGEDLAKFARDAKNAEAALAAFNRAGVVAQSAFSRAASAWDASKQSALSLAEALAQNSDAARQYLFAATRVVQLEANAKAAADAIAAAERDAAKAVREHAKALEEFARVSERLDEIARDLGLKSDAALKTEEERNAAARAFIVQQRARIALAREELAAITGGAVALKQFNEAQAVREAGDRAVAAALQIKNSLSKEELLFIRQQGEELARLELLTKNATGANPTKPPVEETDRWLNQLRDAVGVVQLLGQAFGDVGQTIASVGTGAQSLVSGLQRASEIKNKGGQAVGLGGALSGAAGVSGVISGLGAAGAIVGGVVQIANALRGNMGAEAERQRELYRIFAESVATFRQSVDDAKLSTFQREQQSLAGTIAADVQKAQAMTGARFSTLSAGAYTNDADGLRALQSSARFIAQSAGKEAGKLLAFADALEEIIRNAEIGAAALRERATADLSAATQDSNVALLRARGRTAEADAMQRELEITRQIAAARKQFDGLDGLEEYISLLKEVSAAAALAADAERTRQQRAFGLDLTQRRQTLSGDDRGAFVTGQTIQTNAALGQAQQLLEAGTITAAMFDELRVLLGDEMVQALKDFDEAVRVAKQAVLDDLAVRALVATGQAAEAEALRVEIANRKELEGVTDEALRQQILYVQGLEATARSQARLAEEQRAAAEAVADIDRRMLDVLRTLDPVKAAELETKQREIDRAKELASAASEMIRLRLEELYAMEDAARAQAKLTEEMERQKRTAEELASLTASVQEDYLRATGRTFEADMQRLKDDKETRLKAARDLGASQSVIDQIVATFDAKMNAVVAATMAGETASAAGALSAIDGGIRATTNFASVSDTTALRMLDVQLSQLTVLREIAAKGGAGGSGITVQITVTGSPLVAQTPQQLGRDLAAQLVPALDEFLGRRLGVEHTLAGNPVLMPR